MPRLFVIGLRSCGFLLFCSKPVDRKSARTKCRNGYAHDHDNKAAVAFAAVKRESFNRTANRAGACLSSGLIAGSCFCGFPTSVSILFFLNALLLFDNLPLLFSLPEVPPLYVYLFNSCSSFQLGYKHDFSTSS